jgi:hypothetical protein
MSKEIESRLKKILTLPKGAAGKQRANGCKLTEQIAEYGKKKKFREEAVDALKQVIEHGVVDDWAWSELGTLATAEDQEYLRAHLDDDLAADSCMNALLRLQGEAVYSEAVDVICDSKLSGRTRMSVLEALSEHAKCPFDEKITCFPSQVTEDDLPLDELRAWRDAGYVEPKIEIPEKDLKKAGVTLPDDYTKFLLKHNGRDRLEFDDAEWDLYTAAQLFEPVDVDGTEYPGIGVLKGYVESMRDAFEEGETQDAKGKPYPLDRLAAGIAVGTSDMGDVLYFDPSDGHSMWVFHHDGGDVQRVGKSFTAWKRKARKAW